MSCNSHFLTALLLGALVFKTSVSLGETLPDSSTSTNKPTFNASLRSGETVGDHQIQRAYLAIGTNQMAFIVPTDFRMDATSAEKIVLSDRSSSCFITVRITGAAPAEGDQIALFRSQALARFPGATILHESSESAAGHSGPSFDLQWVNSAGAAQSARVAFVPSPAGILEFSVLSRTVKFKDAQNYLTVLMASVCSNETGKLVISPLPDYS